MMTTVIELVYVGFWKLFGSRQGSIESRILPTAMVSILLVAPCNAVLRCVFWLVNGAWPSTENISIPGKPILGVIGLASLLLAPALAYLLLDRRRTVVLARFAGMMKTGTSMPLVLAAVYGVSAVGVVLLYVSVYHPPIGVVVWISATSSIHWLLNVSGKLTAWSSSQLD